MASALGDVTFGTTGNNSKRTICLMADGTSQAVPSAVTDGVPGYEDTAELYAQNPKGAFFLCEKPDYGNCYAQVISTAGSGTMTATVNIWGYLAGTGLNKWVLAKKLNGGSAIPETTADSIRYHEAVDGLGVFDRLAAEVTVAGTGTHVEVYLTTMRNS